VTTVLAEVLPQTRSGTPGADSVKVKGAIHWLPVAEAVSAEVRVYERLFTESDPDAGAADYRELLNSSSRRILDAYVEPNAVQALPEDRYQFERHGYYVADRYDHKPGRPVFNRIVTLKDSRGR
jgi:glutaminyl-tRNA synthetase